MQTIQPGSITHAQVRKLMDQLDQAVKHAYSIHCSPHERFAALMLAQRITFSIILAGGIVERVHEQLSCTFPQEMYVPDEIEQRLIALNAYGDAVPEAASFSAHHYQQTLHAVVQDLADRGYPVFRARPMSDWVLERGWNEDI